MKRLLFFLAAIFIFALLIAGGAALFDRYRGEEKGGEGWWSRSWNGIESVFFGGKPRFYHLIVEKNGADEKLTEKNVFVLTDRKSVV